MQRSLALVAIAAVLSACGGGGGSEPAVGSDSTPTPVTSTPAPGSTPVAHSPPPTPTPTPPDVEPKPTPEPTPTPAPAPAFAESCAAAASAGGPGTAGEPASSISAGFDVYAGCQSVYQGQRIPFHLGAYDGAPGVSSDVQVRVIRIGLHDETVYTGSATMTRQTLPGDAWVNCCNWPVGLDLAVPGDWTSGYYKAEFINVAGAKRYTTFVVKNSRPKAGGTVFQIPFDTMQAYNGWGGKSAYDYNSTNGVKAQRLSLLRPAPGAEGPDHILGVPQFIKWAEGQGIELDYITSADMQQADVLAPWKVFVTVGHDEYWSSEMRAELDRHIDSGRHAAIFSGNTMWWRTQRVTDEWGRAEGTLVAMRESGTAGANWHEFDPEARTIGAHFFKGGFLNKYSGSALANLPYKVHRPGHWSLAGTGFVAGSTFGSDVATESGIRLSIHAYESDGLDFTYGPDGLPVPTGDDGAPMNTEIIASTQLPTAIPAENGWDVPATKGIPFGNPHRNLNGAAGGWATMTSFVRNGGIVFNIGTTDYYKALPPCTGGAQSPICKIAKNVIDHMQAN